MSQAKKVVLDPKSQKVVRAVMVPASEPVHLASVARPARTFDPQEI